MLRKLCNLAPFRVKKQLVESLILSKFDYASTVFYPLPLCQLKHLRRLQNVCAGYVLGRFKRSRQPAAGLAAADRAYSVQVISYYVRIKSTIFRKRPTLFL